MRYTCYHSDYKATNQSQLKLHQQSKHDAITYNRDQCEYKATIKKSLKIHGIIQHSTTVVVCDQCAYKRYLTKHPHKLHTIVLEIKFKIIIILQSTNIFFFVSCIICYSTQTCKSHLDNQITQLHNDLGLVCIDDKQD